MEEKDYQSLLQAAQEYQRTKNYLAAAESLDQAYLLKPSFSVKVLLVKARHQAQQDQLAWQLIQPDVEQFLTTASNLALVIDVLIGINNFLQAQQLLLQAPADLNSIKQALQTVINQHQQRYYQRHSTEINQLKQQILSIVTLPLMQQSNLILQLHCLTCFDFEQSSQVLLQNPYLHPLLKAGLTEDLVKLQIQHLVKINFYGTDKEFLPAKTPLIYQLNSLISWQKQLVDNRLKDETNLLAAMLYPFTDQIIQEPDLWLQRIKCRWENEKNTQSLEKPAKAVKVDKWLDKLDELLSLFN